MNNRTRMKYKACSRGLESETQKYISSPSRFLNAFGEWSARAMRIGFYSVKGAKNNHA